MTSKEYAQAFVDHTNASPTPYHFVASAKAQLVAAGFIELKESEPWAGKIEKGKKYYLTRNGSSIVAFAVGHQWVPGNGIAMVGAHTDSPSLRIKPVSKRGSEGYVQIGVELYGGGLWPSWFDRDLSVAGRVFVRSAAGEYVPKLIKVEKPLLRIPTLAIHLDGTQNANFHFNAETQLFPIAGLVEEKLNESIEKLSLKATTGFKPLAPMTERHQPRLLAVVAEAAGVAVSAIKDFELILYDVQAGTLGGLSDEFIFSQRLDNQMMAYSAVRGLIDSVAQAKNLIGDPCIRMISCFDHEEIGSESAQGARSNLLPSVVRRLSGLTAEKDFDTAHETGWLATTGSSVYEETTAKSFLLSADMAHAVNPNYAEKYESQHRPKLNAGPVVKINAKQRYSTNSPGLVLLQEVAELAEVPLQLFVVRNDSSCGSTIGPALASALGVRTLDLGNSQLSMHSIRETGGSADVKYACDLFAAYFNNYAKIEKQIVVD
ncbi:peptidase M18 [Dipodascopsis tothii]|uniref:peptidase M18 n=1 Tax=Dipodascopsis tothii TaxID=44089 RepID=UPI0034CE9908